MDRQRLMEYKDAKHFVPGFACETERQKEVFTNFYYAACALIGGEENALSDYCEDEPEYKHALEVLGDHEGLVLPEALQPRRQRLHAQMRRSYCNRNGALSPLR